jgi:protein-tyrosine phosphatase
VKKTPTKTPPALSKDISDILIVCAGNVCRSPMAEAALRGKLYERGIDGIRVHSAGTHGGAITYATPDAIVTAERAGLDISGHRSRELTREMIEDADIVIVMDQHNLGWINFRWPEFAEKIFLITAFRNDKWAGKDVTDPYKLAMTYYETAFDLIDGSLEFFVDRLVGVTSPE